MNEKEQEQLGGAKNLREIFEDGKIDLSLRIRQATTKEEVIKQRAIRLFDDFCTRYENAIRELGGIGFFLGGIGPDGHIAFNVRGSSPYSHTRLTGINYETQAAAAGDLGGIELVRQKAVITMGLETITYNPDCVAIIIAAGEAKAKVVTGSLLHDVSQEFPATCLQKLSAARFYITQSAAVKLPKSHNLLAKHFEKTAKKESFVEKIILDAIFNTGKTIQQLIDEKYEDDELRFAQQLTGITVDKLLRAQLQSIENKIIKGLQINDNQVILHTGPHHDDIELAYFPYLHHLVRHKTVRNHFVYCTSGYTSVTSHYLQQCYHNLLERIEPTSIARMDENVETLFSSDYDDDVTLYLRGIAEQDLSQQDYAVARRIARKWVDYKHFDDVRELRNFITEQAVK